jgi:hypothetical protein
MLPLQRKLAATSHAHNALDTACSSLVTMADAELPRETNAPTRAPQQQPEAQQEQRTADTYEGAPETGTIPAGACVGNACPDPSVGHVDALPPVTMGCHGYECTDTS